MLVHAQIYTRPWFSSDVLCWLGLLVCCGVVRVMEGDKAKDSLDSRLRVKGGPGRTSTRGAEVYTNPSSLSVSPDGTATCRQHNEGEARGGGDFLPFCQSFSL